MLSPRDQILKANYVFYPKLFGKISEEAQDLIKKLLKVDPNERISSAEILQHPWLQVGTDVILNLILYSYFYFKSKIIEEKARELGLVFQVKGRKRLAEETDMESTEEKRIKTDQQVFKEPLI